MRITFRGDAPTWLWVLWWGILALTIVLAVVRKRWVVRAPMATLEQDAWRAQPFELTVHERAIVGVEQVGHSVTFGPSGRQVAAALVLPVLAVIAAGVVVSIAPATWAVVLTFVAAIVVCAYALGGSRVGVWLTPDGLTVRARSGRRRNFAWNSVIDVRTDIRLANGQFHGTTSSAAVGIATIAGEPELELPGFRCLAWVSEDGTDDLAVTHAKVNIVRRYRERLLGPWPKH